MPWPPPIGRTTSGTASGKSPDGRRINVEDDAIRGLRPIATYISVMAATEIRMATSSRPNTKRTPRDTLTVAV